VLRQSKVKKRKRVNKNLAKK